MKLDKIRFATLIGYLSRISGQTFAVDEIVEIDGIIDMPIPEAPMMNAEALHVLMLLMQEGTRKIEAIKQHRMMTGYGLKESKDIVEKYWINFHAVERKGKEELSARMIDKLHQQMSKPGEEYYLLKNFTSEQLSLVKQFIESF